MQAYGIGLVHGMGGSAGVGVLLLAGIPDHGEAIAALVLFALAAAASMAALSSGFGYASARPGAAPRPNTHWRSAADCTTRLPAIAASALSSPARTPRRTS